MVARYWIGLYSTVVTSFTNANRLGQAIALVPEVGVGMDNDIEGGYVGRISQAVAFLCS